MQAGKLRHRVKIERNTGTTVGAGGHTVPDFTTFKTRWAAIFPKGSREFFHAAQVKADITHRVVMRYTDGITSEMQIKRGDRILKIMEPPRRFDQDRDTWLEFACKETQ